MAVSKRCFVFLQMPPGAFAVTLGRRLAELGHEVHKINFCGGDLLNWLQAGGRSFRGGLSDWPGWFGRFLDQAEPSDLILTGDRRPLHQIAAALARLRGIRVFVFEEGYIRPNFITLEEDAVNGRPGPALEPAGLLDRARGLPPPQAPPELPPDLPAQIWGQIKFQAGTLLCWPLFRKYRRHRPQAPHREALGLAARRLTRRRRRGRDRAELEKFLAQGRRYFFVPLQLPADAQIRCHSPFRDLWEIISVILASFKRGAPPEAALLFKSHPFDWQIKGHRRFALELAGALGLEGRVCFVDEADTGRAAAGALGLVLVNSTVGLAALTMGKPVFCLGRAIYAGPGLAAFGGEAALDRFWSAPVRPDPVLSEALVRLLQSGPLVRGNFHTRPGIEMAVPGCLERLGLRPPETFQNNSRMP